MYSIIYDKVAKKYFDRLPSSFQILITQALYILASGDKNQTVGYEVFSRGKNLEVTSLKI